MRISGFDRIEKWISNEFRRKNFVLILAVKCTIFVATWSQIDWIDTISNRRCELDPDRASDRSDISKDIFLYCPFKKKLVS